MELSLKDINICEYNKIINTACSAEADIIVPDTKPDIYKILCVNASVDLAESYVKKGKIIFSGDVKFNVMYVGDNNKSAIYTIEYSVPFNHQSDAFDAMQENNCAVTCHISDTDFKLKNSRKLMAKCNISVVARATKHSVLKALEKVDGDNTVPFRQKTVKADSFVNSKEFSFNVSDTLALPGREMPEEIYDFSVNVNISEIKKVNNKAIIKGTLPIKIFYVSGNTPGTYETEFSFTEIADLDMIGPESILSSDFCIGKVNYEITDDEADPLIEADIVVKGFIKAYEPSEYVIVSDIYSPDYKYSVSKSKVNLEKYHCLTPVQITVKDIIGSKSEEGDISKVHYMNAYAQCESAAYQNSVVVVSGNIKTTVIYSNHQDELCSIHKIIPFNAEIPSNENLENSFFDVRVSPINYGYVLSSDKDVQVRFVLRFETDAYTVCNTNLITDFSMDTDGFNVAVYDKLLGEMFEMSAFDLNNEMTLLRK